LHSHNKNVIPLNLLRLLKICLNENESYSRAGAIKNLFDAFPNHNVLNKRWFITVAIQLCFRLYH